MIARCQIKRAETNGYLTSTDAGPSTDSQPSTDANTSADAGNLVYLATEFTNGLSDCSTSWEFRDAFCTLVKEQLEIAKYKAIEVMSPWAGSKEVTDHFLNSANFKALMEKARQIQEASPADTVLTNCARQTLRSASDSLSSVKFAANVAKRAVDQAQRAVASINRARVVIISPLDSRCHPQRKDAKEDKYLEAVLESTKDARQRVQEAFARAAAHRTSNVAEKLKVIINSSRRMHKLLQVGASIFLRDSSF